MFILTIVEVQTNDCLLMLPDPPATPQLGDIMVIPDGKLYAVVNRAFLITAPKTTLTVAYGRSESRMEIRCTVAEVDEDGDFVANKK